MTINYQKFNEDWKESFIVRDIMGLIPGVEKRNEEYKKRTIAAAALDKEDTPESILEFVKMAVAAQADAIVIDYHIAYEDYGFMDYDTFVEKAAKPIFDIMKSAGYVDTKSYEFRLSYAKR